MKTYPTNRQDKRRKPSTIDFRPSTYGDGSSGPENADAAGARLQACDPAAFSPLERDGVR